MKVIENKVEYNGRQFDTRLEARWAAFFDACDAKWEYKPKKIALSNGEYYRPDFLLHNVSVRNDENTIDLYVEVKDGFDDTSNALELIEFADDGNGNKHPILLLTALPNKSTTFEMFGSLWGLCDNYIFGIAAWQFENIDGDHYPALPCVSKTGKFSLIGPDYTEDINEEWTIVAYKTAEHDELWRNQGQISPVNVFTTAKLFRALKKTALEKGTAIV